VAEGRVGGEGMVVLGLVVDCDAVATGRHGVIRTVKTVWSGGLENEGQLDLLSVEDSGRAMLYTNNAYVEAEADKGRIVIISQKQYIRRHIVLLCHPESKKSFSSRTKTFLASNSLPIRTAYIFTSWRIRIFRRVGTLQSGRGQISPVAEK
jgi:hypothetical protein